MAFRLGHQIICNLNKNVFVRSSSVDSSTRLRSLSPIALNQPLKGNHASLCQERNNVTFPRARSLPTRQHSFTSLQCNRYKQTEQAECEELTHVNDRGFQAAPCDKIKIKFNKPSNTILQPSNLSPIATNCIRHNLTTSSESSRPVNIQTLKRLANVKYEEAVKALNKQAEEESGRYQLEAAKPRLDKDGKIFNVHDIYKTKFQSTSAKTPQLQPKNIKPYGNINTIPWCLPNVENYKLGIVQEYRQRKSKYRNRRAKRSGSESEIQQIPLNNSQKRDYSTVELNADPLMQSAELEKCKSIISEYKKINPDYTEKNNKLKSGSAEERDFIEKAEQFVSDMKMNQQNNELPKSHEEVVVKSETNILTSKNIMDEIQAEKRKLNSILNFKSEYQPKINMQQPNKGRVVLYYSKKRGNKLLCSKMIRDENSIEQNNLVQPSKTAPLHERKPIKVKVGPKLMLQSPNLKDTDQYHVKKLTPGDNEKFIAPWPSWSDRMKLKFESGKSKIVDDESSLKMQSAEKTSLEKLNSINDTLFSKKIDIQKREFSCAANEEKHLGAIDVAAILETKSFTRDANTNLLDICNNSNGMLTTDDASLIKSFDKKLPSTTNRSYCTNCTRGVLGPEGTVMVKLRRLPKINIPEPTKECPDKRTECAQRADCGLRLKPKKLPKLVPGPCAPPPKSKLKDISPLARPKNRGEPKELPRVCPDPALICTEKRADDGLEILPKKLPKIEPKDCFPCVESKMTSPPLVRLKAKPVPAPPPCKEIKIEICPPRADEGLKVTRKKLPTLLASDCCPVCPPNMNEGEPLRRLKKAKIPEPKNICHTIEETCPPRSDEVLGYQVKKKKLQTLILNAKNNNLTWKEFKTKSRYYTTDSKCDMCCYSDKKVHPDIKGDDEVIPSEWDKFEGHLLSGPDGKIQAYIPLKEITDTSTGSTLKIMRKPVGASYWKDEHLHEELLKSGFTTFTNRNRKYSSLTCISRNANKCYDIPPQKTPLKDFNVKRLEKRKGFFKDFPPGIRCKKIHEEDECINPCTEPRMDDVLHYEVKPKRLPILPKGKCEPVPKPKWQVSKKLKRLKKQVIHTEEPKQLYCSPVGCIRADDSQIPKPPKKLASMTELSNCPPPPRKPAYDVESCGFKRLPKYEPTDPPKCIPKCGCLYTAERADAGKDFGARKTLPVMKPMDCPCNPVQIKPTSPKLPRLRKIPYKDRDRRIQSCRSPCGMVGEPSRADEVNNYQVKKKKLKVILKSSNRSLSTLPDNFMYRENFNQFECRRFFSLSSHLLNSNKKECKKLGQPVAKTKCPHLKIDKCKQAKNISCKKKPPHKLPCSKQNSPYPSFSECNDHDPPEVLTECHLSKRHLQPRWPILNQIINQKPPPPYQGKIDPRLEEECIARKLNIELEGNTKTCENFDEPDKPVLTKEMYNDVMKNPPFGECDCANEGEKSPAPETKGPCKPVEHSVCPDPEIECTLNAKSDDNMSCNENAKSKETKVAGTKETSKLTCKKKSKQESTDICNEEKQEPCKEEKQDPCKEEKQDPCEEEKQDSGKSKNIKIDCKKVIADKRTKSQTKESEPQSKKCEQPKLKKCEQPKKADCQSKKKESKDNKQKRSSCSKAKKSKDLKAKESKDSKATRCKNVKPCKKGTASKKATPKKCSDLLKESKPGKRKRQIMGKKPCTPKSKTKKSENIKAMICASVPSKCTPPKSFIDKILDFFRARPNCPAPDQWKKDKLRKKAEHAAAAAGYELCEKKKPKPVKVVCKKAGVKDTKRGCKSQNKRGKTGGKRSCKREKSTCASTTDDCAPKKDRSSAGSKEDQAKCLDKCKVASVVKEKECPGDTEQECVDEHDTGSQNNKVSKSGMKCKLPRQKYCKPPARQSCKEYKQISQCTTVEPPYPCFSECKKNFPKIPVTECTEQIKNMRRKVITFDYDDPKKGSRKYSTYTLQKRHFASNASRGKNDDLLSLLNITDDSLKDMESNELALRILAMVKEGIKSMAVSNQDNTKETYYNIFKELELLCEQELNKRLKEDTGYDSDSKQLKIRDFLSNPDTKKLPVNYKTNSDIEDAIMIEAVKNFCKTIFAIPDLSTKSYEESERIKTEKLQKQLDDILEYYKTQ